MCPYDTHGHVRMDAAARCSRRGHREPNGRSGSIACSPTPWRSESVSDVLQRLSGTPPCRPKTYLTTTTMTEPQPCSQCDADIVFYVLQNVKRLCGSVNGRFAFFWKKGCYQGSQGCHVKRSSGTWPAAAKAHKVWRSRFLAKVTTRSGLDWLLSGCGEGFCRIAPSR